MISGAFTADGEPRLRGVLSLPSLDDPIIVSFVIDTGAEKTLIVPSDYLRYGVRYADYATCPKAFIIGFGEGQMEARKVQATLAFRKDDGEFERLALEVEIASGQGPRSVLGWDVLCLYRLVADYSARYLCLEPKQGSNILLPHGP